ncbi:MAG TPA: FUSC family protein, partial [Geobacter anodireducens]|nr:FUSC family protein [Geobacter anodireducens]
MSGVIRRFIDQHWPHLVSAGRGTAAALAALAVAVHLKLENPYWAAMTALIVIQPTRGLLFEKSFYRLVGTVIGSAAGLLLLLSTDSPLVLAMALSFWVAACVGVGNLLYGLRSYAFMMAACTCVVVAMSAYQNPPHLVGIAFGRVACIVVGIIVSTAVTALFT